MRPEALLIYDMQAGIVSQLPHGPEITQRVGEVLSGGELAWPQAPSNTNPINTPEAIKVNRRMRPTSLP